MRGRRPGLWAGLAALVALGLGALWVLNHLSLPTGLPPSPGPPPVTPAKPPPVSGEGDGHPAIFDTVYAFLKDGGTEAQGYGLYSYALLSGDSPRAKRFLVELFRTTIAAEDSAVERKRLNILYLPVTGGWDSSWRPKPDSPESAAEQFAREGYSFAFAQKILSQLCAAPAESVRALCAGDLTRGPYLLTYASPISALAQFPPPYLVLDLSDVHENAFAEFIAAYKTQVKRADYTDRERIDTFRLELLKIVIPAADWVGPAAKAVSEILHMVDK
ncbi:MAG: hypothetical protein U1F33_03435 [Alphaproteobacteria bacterium]